MHVRVLAILAAALLVAACSSTPEEVVELKGTGGTDSHAISDIGKCATYFEKEVHDERELIAELKAGRFYAVDMRTGSPVASR